MENNNPISTNPEIQSAPSYNPPQYNPPNPNPNSNPNPNPNPTPNPNPNPIPQNNEIPTTNIPQKTGNKLLVIILIIICLGIIGGGTYLFISNNNTSDQTAQSGSSNSNTNQLTKFEDLTKEEAIAFLNSKQNSPLGIIPENYVGDEVLNSIIMDGNTYISDLNLIYSYDSLEDLTEQVHEKYYKYDYSVESNSNKNNLDNFEIKEYDYYAIVTPNRIKEATSCDHGYYQDCDSLLSFKRKYLDYQQEETKLDFGSSINDVAYINTKDPEIINDILRTFTFFSDTGFGGGHGNIYSYYFEEQDDKYILTINNVGAGYNMDLYNNPNANTADASELFAINLYHRRFAVDKSDGHIYMIPTETGTMDYIKSFPITQEEFSQLPGYGNQ